MSFEVGDKVWAQQYGEGIVILLDLPREIYSVKVEFKSGKRTFFTPEGKEDIDHDFTSLFHAGTRIIPAPEPEREKPKPEHELKPFDKVLVRDNDEQTWWAAIFSHKAEPWYCCTNCCRWHQCIPYESNEHLLGTSDAPEEKL
jgi:hypothetical protein